MTSAAFTSRPNAAQGPACQEQEDHNRGSDEFGEMLNESCTVEASAIRALPLQMPVMGQARGPVASALEIPVIGSCIARMRETREGFPAHPERSSDHD